MKKNNLYNDEFYRNRDNQTKYAARKIENIVLKYFKVNSAIDIGCGVGTWLNELKRKGIDKVMGVDGDYVNPQYLMIDKKEFSPMDLSKDIKIDSKYDLAISLEVAEHLSPQRAKSFVKDLCNLSNVVLFAAATKKQGGDGHVNEQRLSYWVNKFHQEGYVAMDIVRPEIWNDKKIPVWYRENIVVFVKDSDLSSVMLEHIKSPHIYDIIHPDLYEEKMLMYEKIKNKLVIKTYLKLENRIKQIFCK